MDPLALQYDPDAKSGTITRQDLINAKNHPAMFQDMKKFGNINKDSESPEPDYEAGLAELAACKEKVLTENHNPQS